MERDVIAELLLSFAPEDVLDGLGLSRENVAVWIDELEKWGKYHRIEVGALALYYSARKIRKASEYRGAILVDLNTVHALVQLSEVEGSGAVNDLVDELKASVLAKQRATVERNREKIEKPTWYEEAIALKEQGLVTSVIARRLEKSPSRVRRVLNKAKK